MTLTTLDWSIVGFVLAEQHETAIIDNTNSTIFIEVTSGANLTSLSPTITEVPGALADPATGIAQDFSNPFDCQAISKIRRTIVPFVFNAVFFRAFCNRGIQGR